MWAYPTREEVGWFTDEKITYYFLSSFLSVSSEIQHPTSCLGRAITCASIAVKKIYTYYISFNISQAWYSSKNHLTLDVQWPILAGPGLVFRIFRIFTINNFVESSPSTTLSNLQHQQLCRKCRIKQKIIFNFQSWRWIRWRLEKIHCINIGGPGSNQLTKCQKKWSSVKKK